MKLNVKSLREGGFCRLGVKWPFEGKEVDADNFTDEQWERLMKEPNLKVTPVRPDGDDTGATTSQPGEEALQSEATTTTDTGDVKQEPEKPAARNRKADESKEA